MKKEIVEIVEELKDNYCEKSYHKYSPFTKFIVDECIKAAVNDHIDDSCILNKYSSTNFVAALLWVFNRAKEEGFVIDYMNDNMTFLYDSKIIKVAGRNGLGIKKYYDPEYEGLLVDDEEYIQRMKDDIIPKLDQKAVDIIELFCCECTDSYIDIYDDSIAYDIVGKGYLWLENPEYYIIAESIIRINIWYEDLREHTNTGKEYDIRKLMKFYIYGSHYDDIRHNIIDGLEKLYSLDRIKVGRIHKLLYRLAIHTDIVAFEDCCKDDTVALPVIVVEYLYLLLILRSIEFNHDEIYTPFITGDVNQIEDRILLELEQIEYSDSDWDEIEDAEEIVDNLFNKYTTIQL
nr:MAG TPA: hypothetical protein [Caudoviricetes sp.]